jgi:HlyD family secretion protein
MKRTVLILAVVAVLALGGWWGYGKYVASSGAAPAAQSGTAGPTPQTGTSPNGNFISASGKLTPARWAELSPTTAGAVTALHAAEGDIIEAGALLVELNNDVLKSQVAVAEAAVAEVEAARAQLLAGATPAEIAAAEADVAAAQGGVAQAQAALAEAQQGVAAAQAQVGVAEAQYRELASRPTPAEKVAATRQIELAQAAVKQAQGEYDRVRGDPGISGRPEALALEQATVNLNSARAAYETATQGATPQQLAVGQAQIVAAKAQVDIAAGRVPSAQAAAQSAQAGLARAQANLNRLKAGATAENRAIADAQVKSAQAGLAAAQAQLAQTQVYAPFAGQIGSIATRLGESATPGQPVLVLGDTTQMRVETTDLRETDVTPLKMGMPVEVTFDALPGRSFTGHISRIGAMSNNEKGSTNYTVVVDVDQLDPALRWGMTAFVNVPIK